VGHYYFDSSALVKRYVVETGTDWINSIFSDSNQTIYSARISGAEIIAAFFRRVRSRDLFPADADIAATQFKTDFRSRYQIVEITEKVIDTAMNLAERHDLRGYDSVQLAAAMELNLVRNSLSLSPIIFVSADNQLNEVARTVGIQVENPNAH
jgi:predicted nucleic acid-binding protein